MVHSRNLLIALQMHDRIEGTEYIGYSHGVNGQKIVVRGTRSDCLAFARSNPAISCEIRKALPKKGR